MPIQERERGCSLTSTQSAEIHSLQSLQEISLAPNVGRNSRLEGTGFNLRLELVRFYKNYNQYLHEGKNPLEALMLSASELEVNIRAFVVEYIQSGTVLPHVNRIEEVGGAMRMVGQNGILVVDGIISAERYGSALKASRKVENYLTTEGLRNSFNRVAVINSPLGHSGLVNEQGKAINYTNNQTMVFWTDEGGGLHGLTLVTDLDKEQSKTLSAALGVGENLLEEGTDGERIAAIVAHPALFSYSRSITNPAKYVFEKILAIRGSSDIRLEQADGTVEHRSVVQTLEDIEKFDSLLQFNSVWEECLKELRKTIIFSRGNLNSPSVQAAIAGIIEETILNITVDYLQKTRSLIDTSRNLPSHPGSSAKNGISPNLGSTQTVYDRERLGSQNDRYAMAAAFLRTRGGCNGGGGSSRTSLRGVSLGFTISSSSLETGSGICSECGRSSADDHYHCDKCGKWYASERNSTSRTPQCSCGCKFGC